MVPSSPFWSPFTTGVTIRGWVLYTHPSQGFLYVNIVIKLLALCVLTYFQMSSPRKDEQDADARVSAAQIVSQANSATTDGNTIDGASEEVFHEALKNGVVLCTFLNSLRPGTVKKFKCVLAGHIPRCLGYTSFGCQVLGVR